jgi:hypothetical protein
MTEPFDFHEREASRASATALIGGTVRLSAGSENFVARQLKRSSICDTNASTHPPWSQEGKIDQWVSGWLRDLQTQICPRTIETSTQAVLHYFFGNGVPVDIGINSINTLLRTKDFEDRHQRIVDGLTILLTGNFPVDMTSEIFHIGRTNVDYSIACSADSCTVTYTLFVDDGFWDVDFVDEKVLGSFGARRFMPDGLGPNLERFGGTPFAYNPIKRSFTFKNPGYPPLSPKK